MGQLKSKTKAGSTCGGCVPLVTSLLKAQLAAKGVAVNNHLCEHFSFSRQEMFHLVRVGELKSFDAVLKKHGRGAGMRHLQAGGRVDPRVVLERLRAGEGQAAPAGHQ